MRGQRHVRVHRAGAGAGAGNSDARAHLLARHEGAHARVGTGHRRARAVQLDVECSFALDDLRAALRALGGAQQAVLCLVLLEQVLSQRPAAAVRALAVAHLRAEKGQRI